MLNVVLRNRRDIVLLRGLRQLESYSGLQKRGNFVLQFLSNRTHLWKIKVSSNNTTFVISFLNHEGCSETNMYRKIKPTDTAKVFVLIKINGDNVKLCLFNLLLKQPALLILLNLMCK